LVRAHEIPAVLPPAARGPDHRHLPARALRRPGFLILAALALAGPARAQTTEAIQEALIREAARLDCRLTSFRVAARGRLEGEALPVAVVIFGLAGCGGSDLRISTLGVFAQAGPATLRLPGPRHPAALPRAVRSAALVEGRIEVAGLDLAPGDLPCCPTSPRTAWIAPINGELAAVASR